MKARLMFLAFIAFEMLVIIGLPRIASQTVIDGLWLTLMAACSTGLLFSVRVHNARVQAKTDVFNFFRSLASSAMNRRRSNTIAPNRMVPLL